VYNKKVNQVKKERYLSKYADKLYFVTLPFLQPGYKQQAWSQGHQQEQHGRGIFAGIKETQDGIFGSPGLYFPGQRVTIEVNSPENQE
jgi:hypothetical protein